MKKAKVQFNTKKVTRIISLLLLQVFFVSNIALAQQVNTEIFLDKAETHTLAPRLFVSIPSLQGQFSESKTGSLIRELSSSEIKELLVKLELSMPFCRSGYQDWRQFKSIIDELKYVYGQKILVLKGSNMHDPDIKADFQCDPEEWDLPQLICMARKFIEINEKVRLGKEASFLTIAAQNIEQHVREGLAVLMQETVDEYTSKITLIDNGTGLINRKEQRVSIEDAIKKDNTFGVNGGEGKGLNYLIGKYSQLSVVEQPGEYAIIVPDQDYKRNFKLNIIDAGANSKIFGTVVAGYFYTGKGDLQAWRDDLCARIKEEMRMRAISKESEASKRGIAVEYWMRVKELDNKIMVNDRNGEIRFLKEEPVVSLYVDLYTIRHGRTKANVNPRYLLERKTAEINKLNEEGEKQAQETAEKLYEAVKDRIEEGNVVIVSSDLKRAVDTAGFFVRLVKQRTGIKLKISKEEWARERNYGEFFRLVGDFFKNRHENNGNGLKHLLMQAANTLFSRPKGGESFLDVLIRSKDLLDKLNEKYKGKTVLLFGHGEQSSAIRTLVADPSIEGSQGYVLWRKKMLNNADFRFFPKSENQQSPAKDIIIQEVKQAMEEKLGSKFTNNIHHGLQHSLDLLKKSSRLSDMLGKTDEVDWKVLTAAVYLHDIFAESSEYHGQQAADFIDENFQDGNMLTKQQIEKVKQAVIFHDKKASPAQDSGADLSLEAKILYDVDNLDAFGIKGIYRYLSAYISRGIEKNRTDKEILDIIKQRVPVNVRERRENLYFDESRQLADRDFPLTKMFFDKLVEEGYPVGTRKGATGVFTFIRENFNKSPRYISETAQAYFDAQGGIEDENVMFTRLYFKRLKEKYGNIKAKAHDFEDLLVNFFQFTTRTDMDFFRDLVERSI